MSAMTLSIPGTWTVMSLPAWLQRSMKASPRSSRSAVGVLALDAIFSTQLTVGVLSQSVPSSACLICGADIRITPIAMASAANSKS